MYQRSSTRRCRSRTIAAAARAAATPATTPRWLASTSSAAQVKKGQRARGSARTAPRAPTMTALAAALLAARAGAAKCGLAATRALRGSACHARRGGSRRLTQVLRSGTLRALCAQKARSASSRARQAVVYPSACCAPVVATETKRAKASASVANQVCICSCCGGQRQGAASRVLLCPRVPFKATFLGHHVPSAPLINFRPLQHVVAGRRGRSGPHILRRVFGRAVLELAWRRGLRGLRPWAVR